MKPVGNFLPAGSSLPRLVGVGSGHNRWRANRRLVRCGLLRLVLGDDLHRCVAGHDQLQGFRRAVIDRLVDRVGRDVDEIPRSDGQRLLQLLSDNETSATGKHINGRAAATGV